MLLKWNKGSGNAKILFPILWQRSESIVTFSSLEHTLPKTNISEKLLSLLNCYYINQNCFFQTLYVMPSELLFKRPSIKHLPGRSSEKLFSVISVLFHERVCTSPDSGVTFHYINIDELTRQMKQITFTKQS